MLDQLAQAPNSKLLSQGIAAASSEGELERAITPEVVSAAQQQMNHSAIMLEQVAQNPEFGPQVQVYAPLKTVAFSRRETFIPGYQKAASVARKLGYEPIIRTSGGRAVAYDETSLVFDLVLPEPAQRYGNDFIFHELGLTLVAALRAMKIDARLGEVPGEYCPGKYSINARGKVKLIGTSQRAAKGARLISGAVLLGNTQELRNVLTEVNRAMAFDWNPATVGSLHDEIGSVGQVRFKKILTNELRIFGEHLFRKDYF